MSTLFILLRNHPVVGYVTLLSLFFLVGLAGHSVPAIRPLMLVATPWFLLITGGSALVLSWPNDRRLLFILWLFLAYTITLLLEIIGVATGQVFGTYHYGPILGWALLGVPLIIGFNWVLVILGFASLSVAWPGGRWYGGPLAALLATGFDWLMEPVARKLGYWIWEAGVIPFQNYLSWFLIALVVATSFSLSGLKLNGHHLLALALVEAVFFAALQLVL